MMIIGIITSLITAVLVSYRSSHIYCLWPQGRADSAGVAFIFRKVPHPCSRRIPLLFFCSRKDKNTKIKTEDKA